MLICKELKKELGQNFEYYKNLFRLKREQINEFEEAIGKPIEEFLDDLSKKYPELKEYNDFLKKGFETQKMITSNMIAYIKKNAKANAIKNTIEALEEIRKAKGAHRKLLIKQLKENIKNSTAKANLMEDLIKEGYGRETKLYYSDTELEKLLEDGRLTGISDYIQNLNNKKAQIEIEASDSLLVSVSGMKKFQKQFPEGYKTFFIDKSTLDRNIKRLVGKDGVKQFETLYDIRKEQYNAYTDILNNIAKDEGVDITIKVNNVLEKIKNVYGKDYSLYRVLDNGNILIKDNESGNIFVVPLSELDTQLEDIVRFFAYTDGGEYMLKQVENSDNVVNNLTESELESYTSSLRELEEWNGDIEEAIEQLKKGELTEEEAKNVIDMLSNNIDRLYETSLINIANLIHDYPNLVTNELYRHYKHRLISQFAVNSFFVQLLPNIELIEEYAPELHKLISEANYINETIVRRNQILNLRKLHSWIKKHPDEVKKFINKEPVYAALEQIPNKFLQQEIEPGLTLLDDVLARFDNIEGKDTEEVITEVVDYINYQLSKFKKYNEQGFKLTKQDVKDHLERLRQSRQAHGEEGWFAYLAYKYGESPVGKIIRNSIENIKKEYSKLYKGPAEKVEEFKENIGYEIDKIFTIEKNINTGYTRLRSGLGYLDQAIKKTNRLTDSYFKQELKAYGLDPEKAARITDDLYGKNLFSHMPKFLAPIREWTYKFNMTLFGAKGISIAFQNLWTLFEGMSLYKTNPEFTYNKFYKLLKGWNSTYKGKLEEDIFSPLQNEIIKYADTNMQTFEIRFMQRFNLFVENLLRKLGLNNWADKLYGKGYGEKVIGLVTNPAGIVDEISKNIYLKDKIYDHVINEMGYSLDQIEELIKLSNKGDAEAHAKLVEILKEAHKKSLDEYQKIYKVAYNAGLSRNIFTRAWFINFFSSWGSKKFADYFFHIFIEPVRTAQTVARVTGSVKEGIKAGLNELIHSSRLQALLKQMYMGAFIGYNIHKAESVDGDYNSFVKEVLIPYQAMQSFVLTRALLRAYEYYDIAREKGNAEIAQALMFSVVGLLDTLSKNLLREYKFMGNLIGQPLAFGATGNLDMAVYSLGTNLVWNMNSTLLYSMFDSYNYMYKERFDNKTYLGTLEGLLGVPITYYGEHKFDLNTLKKYYEFLEKPMKVLGNVAKINFLGAYYGTTTSYQFDELGKQLEQDGNFQMIKGGNIPTELFNNADFTKKIYNLVKNNDLLSGWDFDSRNSEWNGKLQLVFNELQKKGYNIDQLIMAVNSSLLKGDTRQALKLLALTDSKAGSAVLVSYIMQEQYKKLRNNYKKTLGLKKLPEDIDNKIKAEILGRYTPLLMSIDKHFHSKVLGTYIDTFYKDNQAYKNSNVKKELALKLFADIIDLKETDFNNSKFTSVPVLLSKDIKKENLASFLDNMYGLIDNMNVANSTKTIAKTAFIYANLSRIKDILISNPEKYGPYADKLAELIWKNTADIEYNPEILEGLSAGKTRIKRNKFNLIKEPSMKLARAVKNKIKKLREQIAKHPRYKTIAIKGKYSIYKPKNLNVKIKLDEIKFGIRQYNPGQLRAEAVKTKLKTIRSRRYRKPKVSSITKALPKTKSNKRTGTKIKPSKSNR